MQEQSFFMIYTNVWAKLNKVWPKGKNSHLERTELVAALKKRTLDFLPFSRLYLYFPNFSRFGKLLGKFLDFFKNSRLSTTLQTTPASVQGGTWIQSKFDALTIFLHCPLKSTYYIILLCRLILNPITAKDKDTQKYTCMTHIRSVVRCMYMCITIIAQ